VATPSCSNLKMAASSPGAAVNPGSAQGIANSKVCPVIFLTPINDPLAGYTDIFCILGVIQALVCIVLTVRESHHSYAWMAFVSDVFPSPVPP